MGLNGGNSALSVESDSNKVFVAIAGNIGSGKTTLTRLLAERFKWTPHFESVQDNPYLEHFYEDMYRWSFNLQIFFLNKRFKAHQSIINGKQSSIQDRSIYEDANIFARNLYEGGQLSQRDYDNYLAIYDTLVEFLPPPDLVIYLKKDLITLKERIAMRGRDYEANIPDEYLSNLNRYYDEWIGSYQSGQLLVIPSDEMDFLHNSEHFNGLCQQILEVMDQKDIFGYQDVQATPDLIEAIRKAPEG